MDAAEADFDAKLYKASGDILPELRAKIPKLIWHDGEKRKHLRTHLLMSKCHELVILLDRFQEWPQLLDPHLSRMVGDVADGFLTYISRFPDTYTYPFESSSPWPPEPLPRACCTLLYAFCKVRGYKVILRLLNNEPKHIAPMLACLRRWSSLKEVDQRLRLRWEEKYVMLLWLSHLMLAPFELSTLHTSNELLVTPRLESLSNGLPSVAVDVLDLAFDSVTSPSKERESAVIVLARLALRRDMQVVRLPQRLAQHSSQELLQVESTSIYHALGHLSLLYALLNLGSNSEVGPFLLGVYRTVTTLMTSQSPQHVSIMDSAPARKLVIKILRVCLTHAISLSESSTTTHAFDVNVMLEDGVQHYLDALADKDSPVRMAASKALSMLTLKFDHAMAGEVVEAVLGSLSENVLLEEARTGRLIAKTDLATDSTGSLKRNLSAVDALKWHGLMLTLGHLLFRRSAPSLQLPEIIEALLLGLEFEQRSNVGTSVGIAVRDGACFGIWALARKYSTQELSRIDLAEIAGLSEDERTTNGGVLQLIAAHLTVSACLDPSGNIRRGSSAALQELIGRHPDTIAQGISVVQIVDYQAVARRSRAMTEVAVYASKLDSSYHEALLQALLGWRGARAADAESRRWAGTAMASLCAASDSSTRLAVIKEAVQGLEDLKPRNLGVTAGARHGLLLSVSAVITSGSSIDAATCMQLVSSFTSHEPSKLTGLLSERATIDLELVMEGFSTLLNALADTSVSVPEREHVAKWLEASLPILEKCIILSERPTSVIASAKAMASTWPFISFHEQNLILDSWLEVGSKRRTETVSKGRLTAIAYLHVELSAKPSIQKRAVDFLKTVVTGPDKIEIKTAAMESLCLLIRRQTSFVRDDVESLAPIIEAGLKDYTNDQRGDIGSLLRLQSLEAADMLLERCSDANQLTCAGAILMPRTIRLAGEKLNKVRHRAWFCLRTHLRRVQADQTLVMGNFDHVADVSSEGYFLQIMTFFKIDAYRHELIRGLASSAGGGTEEVSRACCSAIVLFAMQQVARAREDLKHLMTATTLDQLNTTSDGDDRDVIPLLDFLTFLVEQDLVSEEALASREFHSDIWETMQKVHHSKANMERVESCIRVYSSLVQKELFRTKSLDKLTRQLLHRYPKIRNTAADSLYVDSSQQSLVSCDWNQPAPTNKPVVLELRKTLGIVKAP